MAIDFHAKANRSTYARRRADAGWSEAIQLIVDPVGKRVADIGCCGGIYSRAWREIGAREVVGVDFSDEDREVFAMGSPQDPRVGQSSTISATANSKT
jgi:2-polyprenyl-3-methyl-5-hydroxy-6-metoxy-1,4-benzoquinol methylase